MPSGRFLLNIATGPVRIHTNATRTWNPTIVKKIGE
jgi:hypothetical protein